jgi:hypothetical protein
MLPARFRSDHEARCYAPPGIGAQRGQEGNPIPLRQRPIGEDEVGGWLSQTRERFHPLISFEKMRNAHTPEQARDDLPHA